MNETQNCQECQWNKCYRHFDDNHFSLPKLIFRTISLKTKNLTFPDFPVLLQLFELFCLLTNSLTHKTKQVVIVLIEKHSISRLTFVCPLLFTLKKETKAKRNKLS